MNEDICCNYIDYLATNRARKISIELPTVFLGRNPLAWTSDWIGGNNRQVAMQESENDSYIIGLFDGGILDNADHLKDIFAGKVDDVASKGDVTSLSKYFQL